VSQRRSPASVSEFEPVTLTDDLRATASAELTLLPTMAYAPRSGRSIRLRRCTVGWRKSLKVSDRFRPSYRTFKPHSLRDGSRPSRSSDQPLSRPRCPAIAPSTQCHARSPSTKPPALSAPDAALGAQGSARLASAGAIAGPSQRALRAESPGAKNHARAERTRPPTHQVLSARAKDPVLRARTHSHGAPSLATAPSAVFALSAHTAHALAFVPNIRVLDLR
jgi:hypothetical protein